MLTRLTEDRYPLVRPLFAPLRYNLVVDSVIDGHTPAWVYADDADHPTAALIWDRQDAMLVAGDAAHAAFSAALAQALAAEVLPDAAGRGVPVLSLHYPDEDWAAVVEATLLRGRGAERAVRRYYQWGHLKVDWRRVLPSGYEVRRLTPELLAQTERETMDQVVGWVDSFWRSHAAFAATGFGFGALAGEAVAGWCLTVFVSGRDYELGLATAPAYRNQGLATVTAAASVEHCLSLGGTPHWHCWEDNTASQVVAAKVGFERPVQYTVYRFPVTL